MQPPNRQKSHNSHPTSHSSQLTSEDLKLTTTVKAMILCAGLGTRLKPWTLEHPKALVPVGGTPMLRRVAESLVAQGFESLTVNVHHFSDQIAEYIAGGNLPTAGVEISDESDSLLDTGGGILRAEHLLRKDESPFLVHNVDILSNANLKSMYEDHLESGRDITLLVSDRCSSRKLIFSKNGLRLKGWTNVDTGETKPGGTTVTCQDTLLSFSGIYIMSTSVFDAMRRLGFSDKFPIMDFLLKSINELNVGAVIQPGLDLIDIGKPDTLAKANLTLS